MGKDTLRKLLKFLNPSPLVGGLEITDSSLKYLRIRNGETIKSSLGLPPGVIEEGRIKDRRTFIAALNSLHARIAPVKKKAHVIASLSSGSLYFSYFHPWKSLAAGSLDEFIKKEVQRLINFYAAHWSGQVGEVILLSSALSKEITALLQENFRLEV